MLEPSVQAAIVAGTVSTGVFFAGKYIERKDKNKVLRVEETDKFRESLVKQLENERKLREEAETDRDLEKAKVTKLVNIFLTLDAEFRVLASHFRSLISTSRKFPCDIDAIAGIDAEVEIDVERIKVYLGQSRAYLLAEGIEQR